MGCESQSQDRQYGEWLRVESVSKGTSEEIRGDGRRNKETLSGGDNQNEVTVFGGGC